MKSDDNIDMASSLSQLLSLLVKQKGSDLHLSSNASPMIRINGDLVKVDVPPMKPAEVEAVLQEILSEEMRESLAKEQNLDFARKIQGVGLFRANIFFQRHGIAAVFRALSETVPTVEQLRLPNICKTACNFPNGLVLVTGPTGSGKSTTLAAMINHINMNARSHILTLEDPIEFQHETKRCMVNQRELGTHFSDFSSALKAALREDPDVILVGEMRDPETIALAITAAETGHLVFGTLHTNTAHKTVDRIIDSFPPEAQSQIRSMLSESLKAVISQKLVPTMDKKSRVAVHDILVVNHAVSSLIREGKTFQIPSAMQTAKREGMQIMDQALLEAVKTGVIAGDVAWEYANDKQAFSQWAPAEMTPNAPGNTMTSPMLKKAV
jgi:twitching motility protein PilT